MSRSLYHYGALLVLVLMCAMLAQADIFSVQKPASGEQVASNSDATIQYTIIGQQAGAQYPSSLTAYFLWTSNDGSISHQFTAVSGLGTDPLPNGDKQYTTSFNVPGCHFFSRYRVSDYTFELVFDPVYSNAGNQTLAQQGSISVPLSIQVNNATFPKC